MYSMHNQNAHLHSKSDKRRMKTIVSQLQRFVQLVPAFDTGSSDVDVTDAAHGGEPS